MNNRHGVRIRACAAAFLYGFGGLLLAAPAGTPTPAATAKCTTAAPTAIALADFLREPNFSQVRISPNGKYLSAIVPKPQNPHENVLAILDGQSATVLRVIPSGESALRPGTHSPAGD